MYSKDKVAFFHYISEVSGHAKISFSVAKNAYKEMSHQRKSKPSLLHTGTSVISEKFFESGRLKFHQFYQLKFFDCILFHGDL
jgi:hypothetical protein